MPCTKSFFFSISRRNWSMRSKIKKTRQTLNKFIELWIRAATFFYNLEVWNVVWNLRPELYIVFQIRWSIPSLKHFLIFIWVLFSFMNRAVKFQGLKIATSVVDWLWCCLLLSRLQFDLCAHLTILLRSINYTSAKIHWNDLLCSCFYVFVDLELAVNVAEQKWMKTKTAESYKSAKNINISWKHRCAWTEFKVDIQKALHLCIEI